MAAENGNGSVTYTTKELLARIDGKIDIIDTKLNLKADQVQIEHILLRLANTEQEINNWTPSPLLPTPCVARSAGW